MMATKNETSELKFSGQTETMIGVECIQGRATPSKGKPKC
jgi:hypothetical protein